MGHEKGQVVPETESVALGNAGVELEATILYADLADSTELAIFDQEIAAEVCKAYLSGTTRLIRATGGHVRSFDGDRVMGIYLGGAKNTSAANCGLYICHFFEEILKPEFCTFYNKLVSGEINLAQSVGIDTGTIRVARAGVRNDNDLIWVGRAPNVAAKLSSIREHPYSTFITSDVYDVLNRSAKEYLGQELWEQRSWTAGQQFGAGTIYRSAWWRRFTSLLKT